MNSLNGNELFMDNREEINQIFQWLRNNQHTIQQLFGDHNIRNNDGWKLNCIRLIHDVNERKQMKIQELEDRLASEFKLCKWAYLMQGHYNEQVRINVIKDKNIEEITLLNTICLSDLGDQ